MNWNPSEGCFEGYCPPLLASSVGAERLECFSMSLNMSAQVTTSFPGEMTFERTIRLEIPITIRRRPDACSSDEQLEKSPAVRGSAASVIIPSTDTTPQSADVRRTGEDTGISKLWTSYKEISMLMDRKARAASGTFSSPLRSNPLSLARLWDTTAPTPSAREVQCWTVGVSQRSSPVHPKTPLRNYSCEATGSREKSSSTILTTTPSKIPRRVAGRRIQKSVNKINHIILARHLLKAMNSSPEQASATEGGIDDGSAGPSKKSCTPSLSLEPRVDSPVVPPNAKLFNNFSLLEKQSRFLQARAAGASFKGMCEGQVESPDRPTKPKERYNASRDRLRNWRKAPERLNEAEKDALQLAIQAAHRNDLEELEKSREGDESVLVEGEDSLGSDS